MQAAEGNSSFHMNTWYIYEHILQHSRVLDVSNFLPCCCCFAMPPQYEVYERLSIAGGSIDHGLVKQYHYCSAHISTSNKSQHTKKHDAVLDEWQ
jgi:hypothetical protein